MVLRAHMKSELLSVSTKMYMDILINIRMRNYKDICKFFHEKWHSNILNCPKSFKFQNKSSSPHLSNSQTTTLLLHIAEGFATLIHDLERSSVAQLAGSAYPSPIYSSAHLYPDKGFCWSGRIRLTVKLFSQSS